MLCQPPNLAGSDIQTLYCQIQIHSFQIIYEIQ
jgi:hypothetical protein